MFDDIEDVWKPTEVHFQRFRDYKEVVKPDYVFPESEVDKTGYQENNVKIQNMFLAGQQLQAARSESYDFPDGKDDGREVDPSRSDPDFDLADYSALKRENDKKLAKQAKDAAEARQKALEAEKAKEKEELKAEIRKEIAAEQQ